MLLFYTFFIVFLYIISTLIDWPVYINQVNVVWKRRLQADIDLVSIVDTIVKKVAPVKTSPTLLDISSKPTKEKLKASHYIRCENQTQCIQPKILLTRTYNVYFCKHVAYGIRFYYLIREGLLLHPNINLVSSPEHAEYIVYLPVSSEWDKSECSKPAYFNKMIVLDEGDYPQLFEPPNPKNEPWALYFKRSYIQRHEGHFQGYMPYLKNDQVLPMTYTILEAYVRPTFLIYPNRDIDILCTLRGGRHDPARERVRSWIEEFGKSRKINKYIAGEVNHASRTVVSKEYFNDMHRSKIIVTANPSGWEGDFRLMEAMASGALVFVDYMYVPRPFPLIHEQHVIYYDNNNKTDLHSKLDYYTTHSTIARKIGIQGYLHAMRYHRASNLIDYIFITLHYKMTHINSKSGTFTNTSHTDKHVLYTYSGYDMRDHALHIAQVLHQQKQEQKKHFLIQHDYSEDNNHTITL